MCIISMYMEYVCIYKYVWRAVAPTPHGSFPPNGRQRQRYEMLIEPRGYPFFHSHMLNKVLHLSMFSCLPHKSLDPRLHHWDRVEKHLKEFRWVSGYFSLSASVTLVCSPICHPEISINFSCSTIDRVRWGGGSFGTMWQQISCRFRWERNVTPWKPFVNRLHLSHEQDGAPTAHLVITVFHDHYQKSRHRGNSRASRCCSFPMQL